KKVAEGRFTSVSEVIRDALRIYERRDNDEYVHRLIAEAMDDVKNGRIYEVTPDFWEQLERDADDDDRNGVPIPEHVKY
ncbi:MAG: ribbon-helix-helix domain-containing protein, partial [Thermomicrobiales bacterium]